MDKLEKIMRHAKCGVFVSVNEHRDYYESADYWMKTGFESEVENEIPKEVYAEMVRLDTVVQVQVYPNTPVGFYLIFHYDLNAALDLMIEELEIT